MKHIIMSIVLLIGVHFTSYAQISTTSTVSGYWDNNNTWDNNSPSTSYYVDVIIETGHTVTLQQDEDLSGYAPNPIHLVIKDQGTLDLGGSSFIFGSNYTLTLPEGSTILVEDGGTITGGTTWFGGSTDEIYIGTTQVYSNNDDDDIDGPAYADGVNSNGDGTFPVDLMSLSSNVENNTIKIAWQTASEHTSEVYKIQRSGDGENWETIGNLPAAGNSNVLLNYEFVDTKPLNGDNYYRLLQMDYDGKFEYFGPVHQFYGKISFDAKLNIYPNPNNVGYVNINIGKQMLYGATIELYDYSGRLLKSMRIEESVEQKRFNISEYPKGIYFIRYISNTEQLTEKLIIQ